MDTPSPSMRDLARRLLAESRAALSPPSADGPSVHAALAVCETLRIALTKFAGPDGFTSLLRRALVLARAEDPALQNVTLGTDCQIEGLEEVHPDAAVTLAAHLLTLLVTFIGESLTLRLVREACPEILLDK